jgi:probable F420-dependent oxidoreductase
MKIGVFYMPTSYSVDPASMARHLESRGFDSLWLPDHPIIPVEQNTPYPGEGEMPDYYGHLMDPFIALAAAATATTRLELGTGVALIPERNALVTAKEVATLDRVSGGRFQFGIGAGWLKEEGEIMGAVWKRRWSQTRELMLAMKACWTQEQAEFHGEYVDFPKLYSDPKPVQQPHPPILIAGELAKVGDRIVEYGDGWIPRYIKTSPADIAKTRKEMEQRFREAGRDFSRFEIVVFGCKPDREEHKRLEDAGADRVVQMLRVASPEKTLERVDIWADTLVA